MKTHKFKSAIIVTDPPHSRRVKVLTTLLSKKQDNLNFRFVSSKVAWWNAEYYYTNERARKFVWHESLKTIASYFLYW